MRKSQACHAECSRKEVARPCIRLAKRTKSCNSKSLVMWQQRSNRKDIRNRNVLVSFSTKPDRMAQGVQTGTVRALLPGTETRPGTARRFFQEPEPETHLSLKLRKDPEEIFPRGTSGTKLEPLELFHASNLKISIGFC